MESSKTFEVLYSILRIIEGSANTKKSLVGVCLFPLSKESPGASIECNKQKLVICAK